METPLLTEADIRHRIGQELQRATTDRHHEWRTPVLATVGLDHTPQARTVVLRSAAAPLSQLQIFTDSRSPKVVELAALPQALLVFWSARLNWQLRVRALATVYTAAVCTRAQNPADAAAFIALMASDGAAALRAQGGFV